MDYTSALAFLGFICIVVPWGVGFYIIGRYGFSGVTLICSKPNRDILSSAVKTELLSAITEGANASNPS